MAKIQRALISVSDKTGVVDFAKELAAMGVTILSTGGTAKAMREAGVEVTEVSDYTGFPEMLDGRLKTLHPKIHGGLLARRGNKKDIEDITEYGMELIDMVVVNLYPFEQTVSRPDVMFSEAIEKIDIGGPTMLRSASKNLEAVTVIVDPDDYGPILEEMKEGGGDVEQETNLRLAIKVFEHTSRYDTLIADYFRIAAEGEDREFTDTLTLTYRKVSSLRYGENPAQKAAYYMELSGLGRTLASARQIQGKEMSFNNYSDTHSALMLSAEFDKDFDIACAIIKHNNPCGVGLGESAADAYLKALKTDPLSAFGGVLAFNIEVDAPAAEEIIKLFVEVVLAPSFTEEALEVFAKKENVRVLEMPDFHNHIVGWDMKKIAGGMLLQGWDTENVNVKAITASTKRTPTQEELDGLDFAWKVAKHVKSNAIVYAKKDRTLGIGIGQTSRVFAARIGALNACEDLTGAVVASDGFFPFRDGIDEIHKMGVTAIVQPGGSVKDDDVIAACDEHDMVMLLTGIRHFKH